MALKPVIFSGGGTLGSVMPLMSVIEKFKKRYTNEVWWCGTFRGPERNVLRARAIPYTPLWGGKFRRYLSWRTMIDPLFITFGFIQALSLLSRKRPAAIVSSGSFISVPLVWAAWLLRIPTIGLQLDVQLGLANRLILPFLSQFGSLFSFPLHFTPIACPVRNAIVALARQKERMKKDALRRFSFVSKPTMLVLGGGIGARILNTLINESIHHLLPMVNVLHSTGTPIDQQAPRLPGYCAQPFFGDDLVYAYAAADIIVSRAGMGTIAEAAAMSVPLILVPLPHSPQEHNAALLAKAGAALILPQQSLTPSLLIATITELLADERTRNTLAASLSRTIPVDDGSSVISLIHRSTPYLNVREAYA
ncbi:MAG: glycosyltransferase [Patescibacteria group bacterium]